MDQRPYPEYKDSGLPWLGKIPAHWEEKRGKYYFREVDERSATGEEPLLSVSHKTGVTPRKSNVTMFMSESNVGYKICCPGDLAINTMWAWMAALGVSRQMGLVSPSYVVYRSRGGDLYDPEYLDHLLRTQPYVSEYVCRSTGIRSSRLRLYPDDFLDIRIVRPPLDEQKAMASFLHQQDKFIRKFIRNRRRLIDVLNEQKQALINQAVTRGVDPNVGLKPSDIDWIKYIPEHWKQLRLKFLVRNVNEQTRTKRPDEIYIALENVQSWTGKITIPDDDIKFDSQVKRFRPNDLLFGKLRPYLAKVTRPNMPGVCAGEFLVLRVIHQAILPEFLEQQLRSNRVIDAINRSTFGAKMPRADWNFIGNIVLMYPPNDFEQREILLQLEKQTKTLQDAIDKANREVSIIREYRTRLIADVVTGKRDIRHLAPSDPIPEAEDLEEPLADEDLLADDAIEPHEEAVDDD